MEAHRRQTAGHIRARQEKDRDAKVQSRRGLSAKAQQKKNFIQKTQSGSS